MSGSRLTENNFSGGFKVDKVELAAQRKHYANHLERTTAEHKFRDSKTAKSRKYAQYLNCTDTVRKPKFSLEKKYRKTYHVRLYLIPPLYAKNFLPLQINFLTEGNIL